MSRKSTQDQTGELILVGAGPGAPELLTLAGASALRRADVVLYDELASSELLALVPDTTVIINVGKRGHDQPTRPQEDINALAISYAKEGKVVVRLKGGDPFVFGRGGEEASACVEAGVSFEVIPGVTSALAAAAYAGIPITDRRHAASFAVVTGHKDPGRAAEATRWRELGMAVDTLVILMGMRNLRVLLERLVEGGKSEDTQAAAVMNASLPEQRVVTGTLASLADQVEAAGLGAPSVVVVGSVVGLRETLSWWEKKPLFGLQVLVTRSSGQASELVSALRSQGAMPVVRPMIELKPVEETANGEEIEAALSRLYDYDDLLFPSSNAVRFFVQRLNSTETTHALTSLRARVWCMGPSTAQAALDSGLPVHWALRGGVGDARALLKEMLRRGSVSGRRVLIPRSDVGGDLLAKGLREAGAQVETPVFYRNVHPPVDTDALRREIRSGGLPILTFTSPSAVNRFIALLDDVTRSACERCIIGVIGQTTATALREAGLTADVVPERPDIGEMVAELARYRRGTELAEVGAGESKEKT